MVIKRLLITWNMFLTCLILNVNIMFTISAQHVNFNYGTEQIEAVDPNEEFKNSPMTETIAVSGQPADLPCNASSHVKDDTVHLVLWYRDHVSTPIYSYDARGGISTRPKEWADPKVLAGRAYFRLGGPVGSLILNSTSKDDEAVYRCRVDFKRQTTTHFRVNLTVIEPISNVRIQDSTGADLVGVAGPYNIGESPTLTCRVIGGDPTPTIVWWRNGETLNEKYNPGIGISRSSLPMGRGFHISKYPSSASQMNHGTVTLNTIQLRRLVKDDLRSTYTCRASNHNLAPSKESSVEIDMNFGPSSVQIRGLDGPVSAGRLLRATCEAKGSRPPATLTWWLDSNILTSTSQVTSLDGKVSTSTLELSLKPNDEGRKLTCRAENGHLPAATVEHSITLQVLYPPRVSLEAGSSLNLKNIKEGDDIYFDCHVKARPEEFKITWLFNGEILEQNVTHGIMIVGKSLVQQKISRRQAGNYSCSATNNQGSNVSVPIRLTVKYAPVCKVEQTDVYGVGRLEKTTVTCRVEADPPATSYRWAFNNTGEFVDIPVLGQRSDLRYSPMSDLDYGTLLCWATNEVGTQKTPCTFTVFPAGKPDSVASCKQFNHTEDSVDVTCEPGYGGGMNQSFLLEAWDDGALRALDRAETPFLQVSGLRPGTRYTLKVYAENSMGKSQPFTFHAFTLTDVAERRTAIGVGNGEKDLMDPVVGSIIGGVSAALILIFVGIFLAMCKRKSRNNCNDREVETPKETRDYNASSTYGQDVTKVESPEPITETEGQAVCDLVSTSQDSMLMSRSQDSTTPSIGGSCKATNPYQQGPMASYQTDVQHAYANQKRNHPSGSSSFLCQQPQESSSFQEDSGRGTDTLSFRKSRINHPVSYVPVLDYPAQYQRHEIGWSESPKFGDNALASRSINCGGSMTPPNISDNLLSAESRRHSAYLRSSLGHSNESSYPRNLSSDEESLLRFNSRQEDEFGKRFDSPESHINQQKFQSSTFTTEPVLSSPASSLVSQQESSV